MISVFRSDVVCRNNLKMSDLTTFKIGGTARNVFVPQTTEQVAQLVKDLNRSGIAYFVLGNGSNVLMPDEEIEMPIIHIGNGLNRMTAVSETEFDVEAGQLLSVLVTKAWEYSLTGMEFAHCIPGTVGGAVYMNAGAFNGEMKDVVCRIEAVDHNGEIRTIVPDADFFGHRYSKFQELGWIITKVRIKLEKGDSAEIRRRLEEISEKRSAKQPLEYPSAGSVFKRPPGYYAGKLIDDAGLKGYQIGGARISEKHGGFIVNVGGATAKDVRLLMEHIVRVIAEKDGVVLEPEIIIVHDSVKRRTSDREEVDKECVGRIC